MECRMESLFVTCYTWARRSVLQSMWEPVSWISLLPCFGKGGGTISALHRDGDLVVGGEKPQGGQRDFTEYLSALIGSRPWTASWGSCIERCTSSRGSGRGEGEGPTIGVASHEGEKVKRASA
jgi:hypothetical protein